jgi:hypothetical protein
MTVNLPAARDTHGGAPQPAGAIQLPAPVQPASRVRRAIAALLADPSPTPVTDAIDDTIRQLEALKAYVFAQETITVRREAIRARGLRRWIG